MRKFTSLHLKFLILLLVVWALFSEDIKFSFSALGLACVLLVFYLTYRASLIDTETVPTVLSVRFLKYIPFIVVEIIKANLSVARVILAWHTQPEGHAFLFAPGKDCTPIRRFILANSITVTPGTITVVDKLNAHKKTSQDSLLIHALNKSFVDTKALEVIKERVQEVV